MPQPIQQIILETERLLLKEITPDIMRQLFTSYTDAEIMSFLGITSTEELDVERTKFNRGLSWYRATSFAFIIYSKQTGERLGKIGYHTWWVEHSRAEIGYHLDKEENKRKGYMTEAMSATIRYGFEQMNLNRIEAMIGSKNTPSLKLVEHFGFRKEGVLRSHYCKNGAIEDSVCFGLLRSEYAAQN